MAKLLFDVNGQLDIPTLILESKSGKRYGSINGVNHLKYKKSMTNPEELSFKVSKYIDGNINHLWDDLTDFKTVYIPEYKEKFEIVISYNDDEQEEKSVIGTFLCASELGQIIIRGLEINTDSDLELHNYEVTKFYNPDNTALSLLHRVLKLKCSHYSIAHVDESLRDLAFEFTADETSVYDFLTGDVAEKMQCLFLFDSITREVYVYDLCSTCNNCYDEVIGKDVSELKHYRDDFHGVCPKCGSTNIIEGYGKDTTILVDKENIATSITRETDTDSLKNCLHVSSGDDLIDAAFIMSNPNGSQYIYRFTDEMLNEMPDEFKSAWNEYYTLYSNYNNEYLFSIDPTLVASFDDIVTIISNLSDKEPYNNYKNYITPILKGMKSLVTAYYNSIDLEGFINTTMCPTYEIAEYNKYEALAMLNNKNIGIVAVPGLDNNTTKSLINSAVLLMAKTIINTALFDIEIENSTYSSGIWNGVFSITDRQNDDEETNTVTNINYKEIAKKEGVTPPSILSSVSIPINGDVITYCQNKIEKILAKNDLIVSNELYSLETTNDDFNNAIKMYSIDNLLYISSVLQSCCDVLTGEISSVNNEDLVIEEMQSYRDIYYDKMIRITAEINKKNNYINTIIKYKSALENVINNVHKSLNLEEYMKSYSNNNLWNIFNYYRREGTYKNENIISDNLESNAALVQYANYLMEFAEKEIIKASTPQISVLANLYNLLMLPEFSPLLEAFEVGNWIRVRTDIRDDLEEDSIYKLRLLSYQINFDEKEQIEVEFSTVTQTWSGMRDVQNIIESAQTIATNFDSVKKEVKKNTSAAERVNNWISDGLDLTNQKIISDVNNQSVLIDNHGILARRYEDITNSYDDCQLRIFNNGLYTTHNNWKSIDAGVGKFIWKNPSNNWTEEEAYGIIAKKICGEIILGEEVQLANSSGSMSFTENGLSIFNGINTININPNGNAFEILKGDKQQLYIDTEGDIKLVGSIESGSIIVGSTITGGSLKIGDNFSVNTTGNLIANNATITGVINATSGTFKGNITSTATIKGGTIDGANISGANGNFNVKNDGTVEIKGDLYSNGSVYLHKTPDEGTDGYYVAVMKWMTIGDIAELVIGGGYRVSMKDVTTNEVNASFVYMGGAQCAGNIEVDGNSIFNSSVYISNAKYIKSNLVSTDTMILDDESKMYNILGLNSSNNLHIGNGLYDLDEQIESNTYLSGHENLFLRTKNGSIQLKPKNTSVMTLTDSLIKTTCDISVNGKSIVDLINQVDYLTAKVSELESKLN